MYIGLTYYWCVMLHMRCPDLGDILRDGLPPFVSCLVILKEFICPLFVHARPLVSRIARLFHTDEENPCCGQMESNEKVNSKQHDKAVGRVSGPACDLAFQDVSVSPLARSIPRPAPRSAMKDTRPIRAWRIPGGGGGRRVVV